jgi:hypothetical protein
MTNDDSYSYLQEGMLGALIGIAVLHFIVFCVFCLDMAKGYRRGADVPVPNMQLRIERGKAILCTATEVKGGMEWQCAPYEVKKDGR